MCLTAVSYVLPVELAGIDSHFHVPVFFLLLLQFHVTVYGFLDIEALLLGNSSLVAHRGYVQYHGGVRTGQIVISYRAIHADIELNNFSMAKMEVETVSFCLNDIIPLLVCSQVRVEKSQVRKVVQECWKLTPAPNGLTYTTYQYGGNDRYQTLRSVGRYYTVTKELLEKL